MSKYHNYSFASSLVELCAHLRVLERKICNEIAASSLKWKCVFFSEHSPQRLNNNSDMALFEHDIDIVITIFGALYFVIDVEYSFPSLFATQWLLFVAHGKSMGTHWNCMFNQLNISFFFWFFLFIIYIY